MGACGGGGSVVCGTGAQAAAIDRALEVARARISRVDPVTASRMRGAGALLVDTRPQSQRDASGVIDGAVAIERNHLEWRLDRTGDWTHPAVAEHAGPVVVFCQEGYSSILAVASLVDIDVEDVHEMAGGFDAWVAAGLPIVPS